MNGYLYAAKIGDFVKIGFSIFPVHREQTLRSQYQSSVEILGVVPGQRADETKFHRKNRKFAVAIEIYPSDAPPIIAFLNVSEPYHEQVSDDRRQRKCETTHPHGQIPFNRYAKKQKDMRLAASGARRMTASPPPAVVIPALTHAQDARLRRPRHAGGRKDPARGRS